MGIRRSSKTFTSLDQLETVLWLHLPIFTNPKAPYRDDLENFNPLLATTAYKEGLYFCEGPCGGANLISPRAFETTCVFCGHLNELHRGNEYAFRPDRSIFQQIYPSKFNPFMNFVRHKFAVEPNLALLGIDIGIKVYQAGMRARYSIVVHKRPFLEIRKGFEFGVLNSGMDNRFAIPSKADRERSDDIFGIYRNNYLSKDPKPLQPSFSDKSFLLGPETEFPTHFSTSAWS